MAIRESDLMIVCMAAARAGLGSVEIGDAISRISDAMYVDGPHAGIVVERMASNPNPVDADIARRMFVNTVELIIGMEGE